MHQQPPQAPFAPKSLSSVGQLSGVNGSVEIRMAMPPVSPIRADQTFRILLILSVCFASSLRRRCEGGISNPIRT